MRADFTKVLTERPRSGGPSYKDIRKKKDRKKIDEDECGYKEGMRYPYGYNKKNFTDLIGPLYKFLRSRVGKPWDKVYSEICKNLKGRSTQQQHLLQHLAWAVTTDLAFENGKLVHANGIPFPRYRYFSFKDMFYVDPRDGILKAPTEKQLKQRREQEKKRLYERRKQRGDFDKLTVGGKTYRRDYGIWYQIITTVETVSYLYGVNPKTNENIYKEFTREKETKVQLNTTTLRKLGVSNEDYARTKLAKSMSVSRPYHPF